MSKPQTNASVIIRVTFLILMGLVALLFGFIFLAVFVPVAGWYIWQLNDKNKLLEARIAALEGPSTNKQEKS
jgi:4-amino-4-deoxy-L-arabinose transferase-like glycosyltransferase